MRFGWLLLLCIPLTLAACDVNFNGYTVDHPTEDWNKFDYVFSGPSPDADGQEMLVKFDQLEDGTFEGETLGAFYAQFVGIQLRDELIFDLAIDDNRCPEPGHGRFNGTLDGDTLRGVWTIRSCQWLDFWYEGVLVGGRLAD